MRRGAGAGSRIRVVALLCAAAAAGSVTGASAEERVPRAEAGTAWVRHAIDLQYRLGHDVELRNAPWIGTHNSFNSVAEMGPTLSARDSNQRITLVDQLEGGMRALELDLHYMLDPPNPGFVVRVCHGTDNDAGCTTEKKLDVVLDEIAGWLRDPGNARQVLLLYLEDDLYSPNETPTDEAYSAAAAIVEEKLGDLVYRTGSTGCVQMPLGLTRRDQLRTGKRVLIVSNGCGIGGSWNGLVHNWRGDPESGEEVQQERQPEGYAEFPECDPEDEPPEGDGESWDPDTYARLFIRYYEDSTQLSKRTGAAKDPITPQTAARMARCGVDLVHLDQFEGPGDPRLRALVWSWARGQPGRGRCAAQRVSERHPHGRWFAHGCRKRRPVACRSEEGEWLLASRSGKPRKGRKLCRRAGAEFSVPRSGLEAQELRLAMEEAQARNAWLAYRKRRGEWRALDRR